MIVYLAVSVMCFYCFGIYRPNRVHPESWPLLGCAPFLFGFQCMFYVCLIGGLISFWKRWAWPLLTSQFTLSHFRSYRTQWFHFCFDSTLFNHNENNLRGLLLYLVGYIRRFVGRALESECHEQRDVSYLRSPKLLSWCLFANLLRAVFWEF